MITFTGLTGTTASNSNALYPNAFTTLSQNNSTQNVALAKSLVSNQHRYLLQKYFDNERSFSITTIGAQTLASTGIPAIGDLAFNLTVAWPYASCVQNTYTSSGEMRIATYVYNSITVKWKLPLTKNATTTVITTDGVSEYMIPANVSKVTDDTLTVGQLKFTPTFIRTRVEYDRLTMFPYKSDIPNYCFIYNEKLAVWPIPSTTGNVITFNYKTRVLDFSFADYTTGNITAMAVNTVAVTGSGTTWTGQYASSTDLLPFNLFLRADPPGGDGLWYAIYQVSSDTSLTLASPVINAPNISASTTYTIGQMPLLHEDFHPMIVHGALRIYYTSIVKDPDRFKIYDDLYKEELALLADYDGTKSVNVDLEDELQMTNPNLFIYAQS